MHNKTLLMHVAVLALACTDPAPKFGVVPADTADTGSDPSAPMDDGSLSAPWDWDGVATVSCSDVFQGQAGSHFSPASTYYASGSAPDTECACSFHVDSGGTLYAAHGVRVMSELDAWVPAAVVVDDNTAWYYDRYLDEDTGDAGAETFYDYPQASTVVDNPLWLATWVNNAPQASSNDPGGPDIVVSLDGEYRVFASRLGVDSQFHSCSTLTARVDFRLLGCEVPDGYTYGQRVNGGCGDAAGPPEPSTSGESKHACVHNANGTTTFKVSAWPTGYSQALWFQGGEQRYGQAWMSGLTVTDWGDASFLDIAGQHLEKSSGSTMSFSSETAYIGGAHVVSDGSPTLQVSHTCSISGWQTEPRAQGYRVDFDEIFGALITPPSETEDAAEVSDPGTSTPFIARLVPIKARTSSGVEQVGEAVQLSIEGMRNVAPPLHIPVTPAAGGGYTFDYDNGRFHVEGSFTLGTSSATVTLTDGWINDLDENGDPVQLDLIDSGSITLTIDEAD